MSAAIFNDARFKWNGTTWTPGDAEWWDYPLDMNEVTQSDVRRSWDGTARKFSQWGPKMELGFSWTSVGTTVRDYVRDWLAYDGSVLMESDVGTWTCRFDDSSYSCSNPSYGVYDVKGKLVEV